MYIVCIWFYVEIPLLSTRIICTSERRVWKRWEFHSMEDLNAAQPEIDAECHYLEAENMPFEVASNMPV